MNKKTHQDNMVITLLGTGTPNLENERWGPSTLIQAGKHTLLIDCGRGTTLRIKQAGINPNQVTNVFLTHLHSDHTVGLPDLWLTGWQLGRMEPLKLWGPKGTRHMANHIKEAYSVDTEMRQLPPQNLPPTPADFTATDIREEEISLTDDLRVTSFTVDHGSYKPALGLRVDYKDSTVIHSGDTRYSTNLIRNSEGADVLIHNAWVAPEGSAALELVASPEEAARAFNIVEPRLAVISHYNQEEELSERIKRQYTGPLLIGKDLTSITITPDDIKIKTINNL